MLLPTAAHPAKDFSTLYDISLISSELLFVLNVIGIY
jgi:hypothetical protein